MGRFASRRNTINVSSCKSDRDNAKSDDHGNISNIPSSTTTATAGLQETSNTATTFESFGERPSTAVQDIGNFGGTDSDCGDTEMNMFESNFGDDSYTFSHGPSVEEPTDVTNLDNTSDTDTETSCSAQNHANDAFRTKVDGLDGGDCEGKTNDEFHSRADNDSAKRGIAFRKNACISKRTGGDLLV